MWNFWWTEWTCDRFHSSTTPQLIHIYCISSLGWTKGPLEAQFHRGNHPILTRIIIRIYLDCSSVHKMGCRIHSIGPHKSNPHVSWCAWSLFRWGNLYEFTRRCCWLPTVVNASHSSSITEPTLYATYSRTDDGNWSVSTVWITKKTLFHTLTKRISFTYVHISVLAMTKKKYGGNTRKNSNHPRKSNVCSSTKWTYLAFRGRICPFIWANIIPVRLF